MALRLYTFCAGDPINASDPSGLDGRLTLNAREDHAWLSYTPIRTGNDRPRSLPIAGRVPYGTEVTYGWWPKAHGLISPGLQVNKEKSMGLEADVSLSVIIKGKDEEAFLKFLRDPDHDNWGPYSNCTYYAEGGWEAAGQTPLGKRSPMSLGMSDPAMLKLSMMPTAPTRWANQPGFSGALTNGVNTVLSPFGSLLFIFTGSSGSGGTSGTK